LLDRTLVITLSNAIITETLNIRSLKQIIEDPFTPSIESPVHSATFYGIIVSSSDIQTKQNKSGHDYTQRHVTVVDDTFNEEPIQLEILNQCSTYPPLTFDINQVYLFKHGKVSTSLKQQTDHEGKKELIRSTKITFGNGASIVQLSDERTTQLCKLVQDLVEEDEKTETELAKNKKECKENE
jgi:hypothetical protein